MNSKEALELMIDLEAEVEIIEKCKRYYAVIPRKEIKQMFFKFKDGCGEDYWLDEDRFFVCGENNMGLGAKYCKKCRKIKDIWKNISSSVQEVKL